jgi:hypothetical protein
MHEVCITNFTSLAALVHIYTLRPSRRLQLFELLDCTEQKLLKKHNLNLIDDQATAKQTNIRIPFFWDITLHHIPGERILSYTVEETTELITDIIHCAVEHTYRTYFSSFRNLSMGISTAGRKSRYKKLLVRSRSREQQSGTGQDPSTGTYGSDKT